MRLAIILASFLFGLSLWAAALAENPPGAPAFLPERLDYRPYVADPRRPRFGLSLLKGSDNTLQYDIPFGGAFPLLDLNPAATPFERLQLAAFAGVWSRFDLHHSLDMVGADYRAGLSLTEAHGPWATRLEYFHESDHRGDEFIIRTGQPTRLAYRREEIGAGVTYSPDATVRLYAEAGYGFILGAFNKPWRTQAGLEWEGAAPSRSGRTATPRATSSRTRRPAGTSMRPSKPASSGGTRGIPAPQECSGSFTRAMIRSGNFSGSG